jgi:inosose dehydratase
MWTRRAFLYAAAGTAVVARDALTVKLGAQTNAWPITPGNLDQFFEVLHKLKAYGFDGFETGFANLRRQFDSPEGARGQIAATGLQFFGIHIFLAQYDPQTYIAPASLYEEVARGGAKLGAQRLILSGAPAASDGVKAKAEALNRAGQFASGVGIRLVVYHNHAPEFQNGAAEMIALMRETNPKNVGFLLDAGHAYEAGANVPEFFREHHERIVALHLRDYRDGEQVPLGAGTFPVSELARAIERANWRGWILCEEERLHGKPGDAAMKPARDALFRVFRGEA